MANWMTEGRKTYDNFGLTLQRFGSMFIGMWIGAGVSHDYPSIFWLTKFGGLLGFGLFGIAHFRAKVSTRAASKLPVR
jgi:hypothetical protein